MDVMRISKSEIHSCVGLPCHFWCFAAVPHADWDGKSNHGFFKNTVMSACISNLTLSFELEIK